MILLCSWAHPTHMAERHPSLGRLVIPRDCSRVGETAAAGIAWAADNFAYAGFDSDAYVRMLDQIAGVPDCLFVTAPDVVEEARATAELFETWAPALERRGLPVALVAQDGLADLSEWLGRTWHRLAALFIGGSTDFKLGPEAEALAHEALEQGKWLHMGRVNTGVRFRYARALGCDSVDGSQFSKWRKTHLASGLAWAQAPPQLRLLQNDDAPHNGGARERASKPR